MEKIKHLKSVLILDDDTVQARSLSYELMDIGYEIADVTFNAIDAITSAQKKQPDIALLDIMLEGQELEGTDVGRKLREISEDIIIIYVTAHPTDKNFDNALLSTPSAFIEKPYRIRTLNREMELAINKALLQKKQFAQTAIIEQDATTESALPNDFRVLCLPQFLKIKKDGFYENWSLEDLIYFEADNVWTTIYALDKKVVLSIGLGKLEKLLVEYPYPTLIRVHNSFIINLTQIDSIKVTPRSGGHIIMSDGQRVSVSRGYVQRFWKGYFNYFGKTPDE